MIQERDYRSLEEIKRDLFPALHEAERIADEVEPRCAEVEEIIAAQNRRRYVKRSSTQPQEA